MKYLVVISLSLLGFIGCSSGGSSTSSLSEDYQAVASATAADLSTEEENALSISSSSVGGSSLESYNETETGLQTAMTQVAARFQNRSFETTQTISDDLSSLENCTTSGTESVDGDLSGSALSNDNQINFDIAIDATVALDECTEENGSVDGSVTTTGTFAVSARGDDIENATLLFAFDINGSLNARGKDAEDNLVNFQITYNDFGIGMDLNFQEALSDLTTIQNSNSPSAQTAAMLDWIKCKGTVIVKNIDTDETNTYNCDSLMKALME